MFTYYRLWKLRRVLDELAIYNDKGIAWKKHSEKQVAAERARLMNKVNSLIEQVGASCLPEELLKAIDNGTLELDGSGIYISCARLVRKY